jgi:hypothetical protein
MAMVPSLEIGLSRSGQRTELDFIPIACCAIDD